MHHMLALCYINTLLNLVCHSLLSLKLSGIVSLGSLAAKACVISNFQHAAFISKKHFRPLYRQLFIKAVFPLARYVMVEWHA
jgi:hypothetical protein